jgi:hypothetical protein
LDGLLILNFPLLLSLNIIEMIQQQIFGKNFEDPINELGDSEDFDKISKICFYCGLAQRIRILFNLNLHKNQFSAKNKKLSYAIGVKLKQNP